MPAQNWSFCESVFDVVRKVPYGRVCTYGNIAKYLGAVRSARLVGWAMNQSHNDPSIPAHRIVNRQGLLTGKIHFTPPERMQMLLEKEGIQVTNDQIIDFERKNWNPNLELI